MELKTESEGAEEEKSFIYVSSIHLNLCLCLNPTLNYCRIGEVINVEILH